MWREWRVEKRLAKLKAKAEVGTHLLSSSSPLLTFSLRPPFRWSAIGR